MKVGDEERDILRALDSWLYRIDNPIPVEAGP